MSATPNVSATEAEAYLTQTVYLPVFLEKLANDFNIVPQDEAQLNQLVEIAATLSARQAEQHVKAAKAQGSIIGAAAASLGLIGPGSNAAEENLIKAASANLANDPNFRLAAEAYHRAQG